MTDRHSTEELVKPRYPTLAYLGFFIFSVILIIPGSVVGMLAVFGSHGMNELSAISDFNTVTLLLSVVCGLFYLWGTGFFYLQRDRFPASLLLLPVAVVLLGSVWNGHRELIAALESLDQAAPEQRLSYALRARSLGLLAIIPGVVVAMFFSLTTALLAALRAIARDRENRPGRLGVYIMIFGVAAGFVAPIFLYKLGAVSRDPWVAFAIFVTITAAFYMGLGSLRPPANVRDGANHLLLAVASISAVALTWLALYLTSLYEPSEVDMMSPEQCITALALSVHTQRDAFRLGVAIVLVVLGVSWSTLVMSKTEVHEAARGARWSAGTIAIILFGCAFFAFQARGTLDDLFRQVSLGEGSHYVREIGGYGLQLPRSTSARPALGGPQTTLMLEPDGVIHVDDQLVPNMEGLSARGPAGYRLRAVLQEKLSDWSMREDGGRVADVLRSHKTMSQVPWNHGQVIVAVDRRVPFKTVMEATNVLRSLGVRSARFIVSTPLHGAIHPDALHRLNAFSGPLPWEYGAIGVRLRPFLWEVDPASLEYFLGLRVLINRHGLYIFATGGVLPEGCSVAWSEDHPPGPTIPLRPERCRSVERIDVPGPPPCAFDYERLRDCLVRIEEEYPEERMIMIDASRDVSFEVIVRVLDAARRDELDTSWSEAGFPAGRHRTTPARR